MFVQPNEHPSTIWIPWPNELPPSLDDIILVLHQHNIMELTNVDLERDSPWALSFMVKEHKYPILVWLISQKHPCDISYHQYKQTAQSHDLRIADNWFVGVQTLFDRHNPHKSYHLQMMLCHKICPGARYYYDSCSFRKLTQDMIQGYMKSPVHVLTSTMFVIHSVCSRNEAKFDSCWLHTHGLNRAGIPELDLLDLPSRLVAAGGHLINKIADLMIGAKWPAENETIFLDNDLELAWCPWQNGIKNMPCTIVGSGPDRVDDNFAHGGYRVILVASNRDEEKQTDWAPPIRLIEALSNLGRGSTRAGP